MSDDDDKITIKTNKLTGSGRQPTTITITVDGSENITYLVSALTAARGALAKAYASSDPGGTALLAKALLEKLNAELRVTAEVKVGDFLCRKTLGYDQPHEIWSRVVQVDRTETGDIHVVTTEGSDAYTLHRYTKHVPIY